MSINEIRAKLGDQAEGMTDEQLAAVAKMAAKAGKRSSEKDIIAKYPHVIEGTLQYDPTTNKQSVEIRCQHPGCKETRRVFTSDLFQVRLCDTHKKEAKKAQREMMKKMAANLRESAK
jgi:hypothetical protein